MAAYEGLNDCGDWDSAGNFHPPKYGPAAYQRMRVIEYEDMKQKAAQPRPTQDPFAGMTTKNIRDMSMQEYAQLRSRTYQDAEVRAMQKREIAFAGLQDARRRTSLSGYDHPYHPENPFNVWRRERTEYIDGDDDALPKMLAAVCLEDWDKYDDVAHEDVVADRAKDAPAPLAALKPRWWRKFIFWRRNA